MIIDSFNNIREYECILPKLDKGLKAIKEAAPLQLGRYDFDGGYFLVQEGTTTPIDEKNFEGHRKFIDVQMITEGSEEMAWADAASLTVATPYDADKDVERFDGPKDHVYKVSGGMFYAVFPNDAHQPSAHTESAQDYHKIVLKLPVE